MDVFLKLAHTVEAGPHTNCKENPLFLISYLAASWRTVHEGAQEGVSWAGLGLSLCQRGGPHFSDTQFERPFLRKLLPFVPDRCGSPVILWGWLLAQGLLCSLSLQEMSEHLTGLILNLKQSPLDMSGDFFFFLVKKKFDFCFWESSIFYLLVHFPKRTQEPGQSQEL